MWSVVSRRWIASGGGTAIAASPSTTVWQASAYPASMSACDSRKTLLRLTWPDSTRTAQRPHRPCPPHG